MSEIAELKRDIEARLKEFKFQTDKIQADAEKELGSLSTKGYKVDKENIKPFMEKFWLSYPTKNPNEWEVAIPVFIPFNIGWFDRTEGGYNIFTINKYTKWLGDEIPTFISHEINLPPAWRITVDGDEIKFPEGMQEKIEDKFGQHITLIEKDRGKIKQGHEYQLIAEIIESGSLPFAPKPISEADLMDSDFVQMWDEMKEKYEPLEMFSGKYSYQGEAWKMFQKYGAIGIFWAMSFGKTVIGTYVFSRIRGPKCLIVPTITLKEQWTEFFKRNCPRLLDEVELYTYQGMSRKSWLELQKKNFVFICYDECLTKNTSVILDDGGIKRIEEILNEDCVMGGKVKNKFNRFVDEVVHIYSSFGEIESTKTHPHLIIERIRNKIENQFFPLSSKNIKTKIAEELKVGDCLLIPKSIPHCKKNNWKPEQLALVALIMSDGHIEKKNNTVKVCVSKPDKKEWMRNVFIDGIASFGYQKFWEFTNKRGDYTIGCCNKEIKNILMNKFDIPEGKKAGKIDINNEIFYASIDSIRKFINVVYSCEGWITKGETTRYLSVALRSKRFIDKLKLLLKKFGIHSHYCIHKKTNHANQYQLVMGSEDFNIFKEKIGLICRSKNIKLIDNKIKFMNNSVILDGRIYRIAKINKIEIEKRSEEVFDFETASHKFVANGILTHNCHMLPADSFSKLATVKSLYRLGLSASPFREDGRTNFIMALTGYPLGLDWRATMSVLGKEYHQINVHVVRDAESKFALVRQLYNPERRTIVFVNLLDIGKRIANMLEIPMISGATKNRLVVIKENKSFVATRVMELGVSIKDLEHIIEVDFLFGSRREELQRTGRLMHSIVKGKVHDIIFTKNELESYGKRLYSLYEKGFRYKLIPHLSGVTITENGSREKKNPLIKKGSVNYVEIINKLYNEGYFQQERNVSDVAEALKKRGVTIDSRMRNAIRSKLNTMVMHGERLWKIQGEGGYRFKSRK